MAYEEIQKAVMKAHSLNMENRERLSLGGVEDVRGFDENMRVLTTSQGDLSIRGEQLHIDRIDLDAGQLEVRGYVQELSYDEPVQRSRLWARLFG